MLLLLAASALAGTTQLAPGDNIASYLNSLLPGSVLEFTSGTYELEAGLDLTVAGTEAEPIVLRAAPGATPVFALTGSDYAIDVQNTEHVVLRGLTLEGPAEPAEGFWSGGVRVLSSAGVRVEGLTVRQFTGSALRVEGDCTDVTLVRNALVDLAGHGVEVGCWDASCWLQGGEVRNNWIGHLSGEGAHGILLHHGSQGVTVVDNVVADVAFRGLTAGSAEYGDPNVIEGNALWDIGEHGMLLLGASRVRNNVVLRTGGSGIRTAEDAARPGLSDVVIAYNTVAESGDWSLYLEGWPDAPGMVLSSNAVGNPVGFGLWYPQLEGRFTTNRLRANVVSGAVDLDARAFPEGASEGDGWEDFENIDARDVYPARLSAMIDAGDGSSEGFLPAVDFNGTPRDGSAPDAGAYSYVAEGNPGWALIEGFKELGYAEEDRTAELGGGCCSGGSGGRAWVLFLLLPLALRRRR